MRSYKQPDKNIIISDSYSALKGIKQLFPSHQILIDIKEELYRLQLTHVKIEFLWVPSHVGIPSNEKVNEIARHSIGNKSLPYFEKVPAADFKSVIKGFVWDIWQ